MPLELVHECVSHYLESLSGFLIYILYSLQDQTVGDNVVGHAKQIVDNGIVRNYYRYIFTHQVLSSTGVPHGKRYTPKYVYFIQNIP